MNCHLLSVEETFRLFNTDANGISTADARQLREQYGPNRLTEQKRKTPLQIFLGQFAEFMILVLLAAAIISGMMGDLTDTIVILIIVVLNAVIGFVQEYRAEQALEALKKMVNPTALVMRNGTVYTINSEELVPGDLILLEAGNRIPADIRLTETYSFRVEEASLTGESHAVEKNTHILTGESLPLGDRINMAYKGTFATYGRARGVVVATGMNTELGKIASLLQQEEVKTPLQKRLAVFSRQLSLIILVICVLVFLIGYIKGEEPLLMMLTAISLAVAAIPEALPAVITIALAIGARRMIRLQALIRKLPAVETLGSVTYICSDKTGTLTQNLMTVQELFDGASVHPADQYRSPAAGGLWLLKAMALSNDVSTDESGSLLGDPTELALVSMAAGLSCKKNELLPLYPRLAELPFDSGRKCMSTLHREGDRCVVFVKGALDVLLTRSNLSAAGAASWQEVADGMASRGLRVLGFAMKELPEVPPDPTPETIETGLTLLGFAGLIDPPRAEVRQAVAECKTAGVQPVMITGDHVLTAQAIASELGILEPGDKVITGPELAKLTERELISTVEEIRVYARVSPEQKLNIVSALQQRGHFVAMTGDGVNDAPSLKRADVGVAMGITGTDVSKEAADMILLDDNFATIVSSIREGRRIFDNIRKFIRYTMTSNAGEIWTIFLAPFFGLPVPLLPIHILWINLVTDGLPGLALASEKGERNVMQRPPRHPKETIFANGLGTHILWVGLLMGLVCIFTQAWAIKTGHDTHWQTMVFTVLCFSQMGHVFAVRSETDFLFRQGIFSNRPLTGAVLITFVLQLATIYVPVLNPVFRTAPLTLSELAVTLGLSLVVFHAVELEKYIVGRKRHRPV